jgi:hypothetical protein
MSDTHFCQNTRQTALIPLSECSCVEHGDDGTRYHEDASYEGTVYQCLCGERFMEKAELANHIAEAA